MVTMTITISLSLEDDLGSFVFAREVLLWSRGWRQPGDEDVNVGPQELCWWKGSYCPYRWSLYWLSLLSQHHIIREQCAHGEADENSDGEGGDNESIDRSNGDELWRKNYEQDDIWGSWKDAIVNGDFIESWSSLDHWRLKYTEVHSQKTAFTKSPPLSNNAKILTTIWMKIYICRC